MILILGQFLQIGFEEGFNEFIAIELADLQTGILIARHIGWVPSQEVASQLVNGIITFFLEGFNDFVDGPGKPFPSWKRV